MVGAAEKLRATNSDPCNVTASVSRAGGDGELGRFSVTDCTGAIGGYEGVGEAFEEAETQLRSYLDGRFAVRKVQILMVPEEAQYILVSRNSTSKLMLDYSVAFRAFGRGEDGVRSAVRRFVHELTHLALGAQVAVTLDDEEYLASVAESCVEFDVFGSARLAVSGLAPDTGFNRRQRASMRASYGTDMQFPGFCRKTLGSLAVFNKRAHQAPR